MLQTAAKIIKWISIPVLLIASVALHFSSSFEFLLDSAICLGAVVAIQRAFRSKEYFWAAGFVPIAVIFSPAALAEKIFILMGFTCIAIFVTLLAVFQPQPVRAN